MMLCHGMGNFLRWDKKIKNRKIHVKHVFQVGIKKKKMNFKLRNLEMKFNLLFIENNKFYNNKVKEFHVFIIFI